MKTLTAWPDRLSERYGRLDDKGRAFAAFFAFVMLFCLMSLTTRAILLITGKSIVWRYDSSGEYYITFERAVEAVRALVSGKGFAQFDLRLGLGDDVISSMNFYGFGDPLISLLALLPVNNMEALFTLSVYLRQFLAGWFCYLYLRKMGAFRGMALIGAISFAFCAFVNHNILRHQLFLNAAVYLPLVLLGYEMVLSRRSAWLLAVSVAMLAMCTYYFLYMISVFLLVYALIRYFQKYPKGRRSVNLSAVFLRSAVAYIIGVCMAGVILLPAVYGFFHSARLPNPLEENLLFYTIPEYMQNISFFGFPLNANMSTMALLSVFSMVLFVTRGYAFKKWANLCAFLLVIAYIVFPWVSYALNGFSHISSRPVFLLSMIGSVTLSLMGTKLFGLRKSDWAAIYAILLVMFVFFIYTLISSKDIGSKSAYIIYIALLGALAAFVMIILHKGGRPGISRPAVLLLTALAVVANLTANETLFSYWRYQNGNLISAGRVEREICSSPGSSTPAAGNGEICRVEIPGNELTARNESVLLDYASTACYLSVQNANKLEPMTGLENIGRQALHLATGLDGRASLMTALNVKYFATNADSPSKAPYGFTKISEGDGHVVYENKNALPLFYTTDRFVNFADYEKLDGLGREQAISKGVVIKNADGFNLKQADISDARVSVPVRFVSSEEVSWSDGVLDIKKAGGKAKATFAPQSGCEVYLRFVGLDADDSEFADAQVYVEGDDVYKSFYVCSNRTNQYSYGQYDYLVNLGWRETPLGEVSISFDVKGKMKLKELEVFCLSGEALEGISDTYSGNGVENLTVSGDRISANVTLDGDGALVLGIPWSEGWTALVDGQKARVDEGSGLVMTVALTSGSHEVAYQYSNPWFNLGFILTCLSPALLAAFLIIDGSIRKKEELKRRRMLKKRREAQSARKRPGGAE